MKYFKAGFIVLALLLFALSCKKTANDTTEVIENEPPVLIARPVKITEHFPGFYLALPVKYNEGSKKYPLIIWMHGNGQAGNGTSDLPKVLYGGIPKLLDEKLFPPNFQVDGNNFSFIVLAPQYTMQPSNEEVMSLITYASQNYLVDVSRIYLSGASLGGVVTTDVAASYCGQLAAIIPISGVSYGNGLTEKCAAIAHSNLPVWIFQNNGDDVFDPSNARNYVSLINGFKSAVPAKYTEFLPFGDNGHDAWTKATDPDYRENGMNIYEWMLQYHR